MYPVHSMPPTTPYNLRRNHHPAFAFPPLAPFLAAGIAASLEAAARHQERKRQPQGQLIALRNDGRRVHVIYHAPPSLHHAPCVVLEAGSNSWSPMWNDVATQLGHFARVLRYDRAGFGYSDPVPDNGPRAPARSVANIAEELAAMMATIGAHPPYVLVAHSLGALYINMLMHRLAPGDVCGVVYVDAASPETVMMLENVVPAASPPKWLAHGLSSLGVLRLLTPWLLWPYTREFRGELMKEVMATWARAEWLMAYTREWTTVIGWARGEGRSQFFPGWLGTLPIAVLVPDVYERTAGKAYVARLQATIANYSSDAKLTTVRDCGHFVQLERPDVVASAVQSVIKRAEERATLMDRAM